MSAFLLPPPKDDFTGSKQIVGTGGYSYPLVVEPAGREIHRRLRNLAKGRTYSQDSLVEFDGKTNSQQLEEEAIAKYRKQIKGKKFLELTMYQQLGLQDYGFNVTEDQIKKAYHRALIEHHPDKTGKTESDPNYLAVQKAFATLTDVQKKRAYDSQCNFDEWIPTGTEEIKQNNENNQGKCFYALYGPVFEANSRFSETQPVPLLGDESTEINSVYDFYDFWHKFDSWRDFTHDAEHDVESAEHREEKRWMAKQNENVAKKKKRKEYARLANLVDRAFSNDPRIKQSKKAEKEAKEKAKREKREAIERKEREAAEAIEAVARETKEKEEKQKAEAMQAKFAKEKIKKAIRKVKKSFRETMEAARNSGISNVIDAEDTEFLCEVLEFENLKDLVDAIGEVDNLKQEGFEKVVACLTGHRGEAFMKMKDEQKQVDSKVSTSSSKVPTPTTTTTTPWSDEELSLLAKCTVKFPGGTGNRWQTIADTINNQLALKVPRSKEECIAKAQEQSDNLNRSRR